MAIENRSVKAENIGISAMYSFEANLPHIVFDLSIEDINLRKEKAKQFDNAREVAAYLEVKVDVIFRNRLVGKKVKALNGKYFAVRISK